MRANLTLFSLRFLGCGLDRSGLSQFYSVIIHRILRQNCGKADHQLTRLTSPRLIHGT